MIISNGILKVKKNTKQTKALSSCGFSCIVVFPRHSHNTSQKHSFRNVSWLSYCVALIYWCLFSSWYIVYIWFAQISLIRSIFCSSTSLYISPFLWYNHLLSIKWLGLQFPFSVSSCSIYITVSVYFVMPCCIARTMSIQLLPAWELLHVLNLLLAPFVFILM